MKAVFGEPKTRVGHVGFFAWLRNQSPLMMVAAIVLFIYAFIAFTGSWWAPYPPNKMLTGAPYSGPSLDHWLGTDNLGRDVLSRMVNGTRIDLGLALSATGLATIFGTLLGLLTGYFRGTIDAVAMRVIEILLSIPTLILALLVLGSLGASLVLIVLVTAFLYMPRVAIVIRAATLNVVTEDYVTAAQLRGESALSIALRELLPNVLAILLVEFSLRTGYAVIFIGGLGFLGFGVSPPTPEWGLMINEGRQYISFSPWSVLGPSFAIALLVVALSFFTEGLSETLGLTARKGF